MSDDIKREVTTRYGISDKAAGGFGGGFVKIRYYESSPEIDLEISTSAVILNSSEAIMLAKALLGAAMPSEANFWPDN
ncbi:hypothetical protein [Rhodococcus jostii]|uniref:hypothetical protein n=1 Tax=Rhodococcus jostii TaxID=132919 RepID=UPI0036268665